MTSTFCETRPGQRPPRPSTGRPQKSIPVQIRQLILYIGNNKGYVAGFVRELTFAKRHYKRFMWDKTWSAPPSPLAWTATVLQKSIPVQIRQLLLHTMNNKEQVDRFVRELTLAEQRCKHFM